MLQSYLIALVITAIWGYFADLRNGQVEWFVARILILPVLITLMSHILGGR